MFLARSSGSLSNSWPNRSTMAPSADCGPRLTPQTSKQEEEAVPIGYQYATYEKRGHIAYVTINRPEVMNALHPEASAELSGIWDDFAADADAWVAILTGAGDRAFSAGNDLKATAQRDQGNAP